MTDSYFDKIKAFHDKHGLGYDGSPRHLDDPEERFRMKCFFEEIDEYQMADAQANLTEKFDALVDLAYFCIGTAHRMGLPFDLGFDRVHQTNMLKEIAPNGDLVKPANWEPAWLQDLVSDPDVYADLRDNVGLITVDGPDGTGKTTLAQRIALLTGGEHIHLTWTRHLDRHMDRYRTAAIDYASCLAGDKVVVLERPWLSHPVYQSAYRNDEKEHDWRAWRAATELAQDLGVIALPEDYSKWFQGYVHACDTRDEHYSNKAHGLMAQVYRTFSAAFHDKPGNILGDWPLDRATHIQYDCHKVGPAFALDCWIIENIVPHLGRKNK